MRYFYCPKCKRIYNSDFLQDLSESFYCPDIQHSLSFSDNNDDELIEIDEFMAYPILLLNQKEYTTEFCCSGHIGEDKNYTYIAFKIGCCPSTTPEGWVKDPIDVWDDKECIRIIPLKKIAESQQFNTVEEKQLQQEQLFKAWNNLLKWAIALPHKIPGKR